MLGIALLKFWKVTAIGVVAVGALAAATRVKRLTAPAPSVSFRARNAPFRIKAEAFSSQMICNHLIDINA